MVLKTSKALAGKNIKKKKKNETNIVTAGGEDRLGAEGLGEQWRDTAAVRVPVRAGMPSGLPHGRSREG